MALKLTKRGDRFGRSIKHYDLRFDPKQDQVLANFKQVLKQDAAMSNDVRIHPMVARQVDPELLKKMGAAVDGGKDAG